MNKRALIIKLVTGATVIGLSLIVLSQVALGQFVRDREYWRQDFISRDYRPRYYDPYENLATYDVKRYPRVPDSYSDDPVQRGLVTPVTYDQFGNYLLPGAEIYNMTWDRSRLGADRSSTNMYNSVFNRLVISSEEIGSWQSKFMIARSTNSSNQYDGGIRTFFTPSTMKMSNFDGFRWDTSSRKNNLSIVASPGTYDGKPLYGAHWESVLGDILKVGATYVHKQRGTISNSHEGLDARLRDVPRYVYVVITDDSPEDVGNGPRVYDIRAIHNGNVQPIAFKGENYRIKGRMFKVPSLLTMKRYYESGRVNNFGSLTDPHPYLFKYEPPYTDAPQTVSGGLHRSLTDIRNADGSWFMNLLTVPSNPDSLNKPLCENIFQKNEDTGTLGYLSILDPDGSFDPDDPKDRKRYFKADTSEGYAEANGSDIIVYEVLLPSDTKDIAFNVLVSNDYCIDIIATMYNRLQGGEADWYDPTLTDAWSKKFGVGYLGKHCTKSDGNVKDNSNMEWVKVQYDRMTGMSVYGMNMEFNWRGLFIRGEYNEYTTFRSMPVDYTLPSSEVHEYTSRAWFVNAEKTFDKWSLGGELFDYPLEYMQYWSTVEDNDDNNRYSGSYIDGSKRSEHPGLDVDFDRYIDTDWQDAPYLNYYYDDIVIGDDFNHDGTVDMREDDMQSDLPYERDSRGQHYFVKFRPRESTLMSVGHYDVRQTYYDGRNFTRYFKLEHFQRIKGIGEFIFYNRTERIKDNYKLYEDYHQTINNIQTTNILHTRLTFIPNMNITNNVRYKTSYDMGNILQLDGTPDENVLEYLMSYSNNDYRNRFAAQELGLEHKADYTLRIADQKILPQVTLGGFRIFNEKRIKEFVFTPMFKVVHSYSFDSPTNLNLRRSERRTKMMHIYPVLRFDYRIAPKTQFRCGIQGVSGLPERYRVEGRYQSKLYDYDSQKVVLALENRSLYQGFNLLVMMGVSYEKVKYPNDPTRKDPGATRYFITVQSESTK